VPVEVIGEPATEIIPPVKVWATLVTPPGAGVCQVAAVPLVAVNTCPLVGADEEETFTTVVAEFSALVLAAVPVVSWFHVGIVPAKSA
jgi:hypothetical protein